MMNPGYKPALKPLEKYFFELLMKFAQTTKVVPVPIEKRSGQELLDLLEQTRRNVERAEILFTLLCCWDGSEGLEEEKIIECLGLLVVAYEVGFWYDQTENKIR